MKTITLSKYTVGKYLGTDDPTVNWTVMSNGSPCMPEVADERRASELARALYHQAKGPRRLELWNGDNGTATTLEEARA